jgi:hypothetical protein
MIEDIEADMVAGIQGRLVFFLVVHLLLQDLKKKIIVSKQMHVDVAIH